MPHKVLHLNPVNGRHTLMIHGYMTGYMAKTILKLVGNCKTCHELITHVGDTLNEHMLIKCRAYNSNFLLKPRTKFMVLNIWFMHTSSYTFSPHTLQ
jgi:hypothetical protein